MKERPILFSGEMVWAILWGRKTQTRRIVKTEKYKPDPLRCPGYYPTGKVAVDMPNQSGVFMEFRHKQQDDPNYEGSPASFLIPCPHGKVGDRLWVREAHFVRDDWQKFYKADESERNIHVRKWTPSIHMKREHSRITLEITNIRVERLNDISARDILAEGVDNGMSNPKMGKRWENMQHIAFVDLWEKINGEGSWDANPWVWVIEFKVVKP